MTDAPVAGHPTRRHGRPDVPVDDATVRYATWQRASSADPGVVREAVGTNFSGPWRTVPGLLPLSQASRRPRW